MLIFLIPSHFFSRRIKIVLHAHDLRQSSSPNTSTNASLLLERLRRSQATSTSRKQETPLLRPDKTWKSPHTSPIMESSPKRETSSPFPLQLDESISSSSKRPTLTESLFPKPSATEISRCSSFN